MANRFAVANGNFNATSTWSTTAAGAPGASVPIAGDNAIANNFTVTITANQTCDNITNGTTYGGTAGGGFVLNDGITLTVLSSVLTGAIGGTLRLSGTNSATVAAVSITSANVSNTDCILHAGTGALTVNSTTIQSGGLSANASRCINLTAAGTANITASTITGGAETVGTTGAILGGASSTININAATLTGGTAQSSPAVNANGGICFITGNLLASTSCQSVTVTTTTTLTVVGNVTAANGKSTIVGSPTNAIRVSGSFIYSADGTPPTTQKLILNTTPTASRTRYALNGSGTYVDMFTTDNSFGQANVSDVRFGTVYASGTLTGVAYIPSAGSVAAGVPVDNTVGTATLTAANVRAALGMASANMDTQLAAIPTAITNAAAVRTNLATELGRIDATISSRSTLTAANVRTELTPELAQVTEVHKIHGLDIANALTVTPTLRSAGAITQAITGDGTTNTIVTRV